MLINVSIRWLDQVGLQQSKIVSKILNTITSYSHFSEFYKEVVGKKLLFHMPQSPDLANHLESPAIHCIYTLNIYLTSNLWCAHVLRISSRKSLI